MLVLFVPTLPELVDRHMGYGIVFVFLALVGIVVFIDFSCQFIEKHKKRREKKTLNKNERERDVYLKNVQMTTVSPSRLTVVLSREELGKSKPITVFVIYVKKYIRLHELQIGHKQNAEMWLRTNLRTLEKSFKQDLGFAPIIKAPEGHKLIPYLRFRIENT